MIYLLCSSPEQVACAQSWAQIRYTPVLELPSPADLAGANVLVWPIVYNRDSEFLPELARIVGQRIRIIRATGLHLPETYDAFLAYAQPIADWIVPGKRLPRVVAPAADPAATAEPINGNEHTGGLATSIAGIPASHLVPAEIILSREFIMDARRTKILPLVENAVLMLERSPAWQELRFDEFASRIIAPASCPVPAAQWDDTADISATCWFQQNGLHVGKAIAADAIVKVSRKRGFHPLKDYLNGLVWDETARIDHWLADRCETDESPYIQNVGAKWLIQAVARIYQPGVKADTVLIFQGGEGLLKSSAFRVLAEPWFSDDMPDLSDRKDSALQLDGVWVIELSELSSIRNSETEQIWSFISRQTDRYRPPYGHHVIEQPRRCVFAGTTNREEPLKGDDNQRRWWPVTVRGKIDLGALREARDQLWAEAVVRFRAGEPWWLQTDALVAAARDETEARRARDPWHDEIAAFVVGLERVSNYEVLKSALNVPIERHDQLKRNRVAGVFRALGWRRRQVRVDGALRWVYLKPETR